MPVTALRKPDFQQGRDSVGSTPIVARLNAALAQRYATIRAASLALCAPLSVEDAGAQSMADASPAKWHLAHTTWFFETLVLRESSAYRPYDPAYARLFNSYYQQLGKPCVRARRGLLTRPAYEDVLRYRAHVDREIDELLAELHPASQLCRMIELGLQHEQQHQELILTDIKHLFWRNPLRPAYVEAPAEAVAQTEAAPLTWQSGPCGMVEVGHDGQGFAFDNEGPRHQVVLTPHAIASRPATNREYRAFIQDGGYRRPELWLAEGWSCVQERRWKRPLYWAKSLDNAFTLHGEQALDADAAVCHLSYYEADAYARWAQARLPTEDEWEASAELSRGGENATELQLHPRNAGPQWFGQVWTWTSSAYQAYPGYQCWSGVIGEYNGKFMCNQMVLRGSSCATPPGHARSSYRNFFHPQARWQFSGVRLARDL